MKKFALVGAAGFVAPRHVKAIYDNNSHLIAACDTHDSVGVLDKYFPETSFHLSYEEMMSYITNNSKCDYTSICSPNFLHLDHITAALKADTHVICEKPLVLKEADLDLINELQYQEDKTVNCILQLRLLDSIKKLKSKIDSEDKNKVFDVDLTYITSRGPWYLSSWKGDNEKSGGIASNIGIHFFDLLYYLFGKNTACQLHYRSNMTAAGYLEFEKARVRWILSIDKRNLPNPSNGKPTYRSITIDGCELEFSDGFTELHTEAYKSIINGEGFTTEDTRCSISLTEKISSMQVSKKLGDTHPMFKNLDG